MTTDAAPAQESVPTPDEGEAPPPFSDDASRIADAAVEQLRARRFSYGDDRCAMEVSLAQDEVYSDDYKARLMEGFTDTAEAEAAALA